MRKYQPLIILTLIAMAYGCGGSGSNAVQDSTDTNIGSDSSGLNEEELDTSCPLGSEYDAEEDSCFIDCTDLTDAECDALDVQVFGEFDEFVDGDYEGRDFSAEESGSRVLANYSVEQDLSLTEVRLEEPANDTLFRTIWSSVAAVLPKSDIQQSVATYLVDTDGESGTLAYVTPDDMVDNKWVMSFDNADYVSPLEKEFIHTTVHEFGHIVFLRKGQVDMSALGGCPNYSIDEGCSETESHLNRFYQLFWTDIIDEHTAATSASESEASLSEFYNRYSDRFVSEYAATNPVEDAAEIFTHFVLRDKPAANSSVVDQKILFMHGIDDLVKKRTVIRGKLARARAE